MWDTRLHSPGYSENLKSNFRYLAQFSSATIINADPAYLKKQQLRPLVYDICCETFLALPCKQVCWTFFVWQDMPFDWHIHVIRVRISSVKCYQSLNISKSLFLVTFCIANTILKLIDNNSCCKEIAVRKNIAKWHLFSTTIRSRAMG